MKIFRVSTQANTSYYAVETEQQARDAHAVDAGYRDAADVAHELGMSEDRADADLIVTEVALTDVVRPILDLAMEGGVRGQGAEDPFQSLPDWADWCLAGDTGESVRDWANLHKIDLVEVRAAVREELIRLGDLDEINEPFSDGLEDGVYEGEGCKVRIDDDEQLPSVFYHREGERLTRYWYQGQGNYEAHEHDVDEHGRTRWIGCGTFWFDLDTTAGEFLELEQVDE